jgi:hypothetical protein
LVVNGRDLKNCRLHLLVAVGFDDVVRASSKEHVAAAAVAAAASADKLPRGCGYFKRLKDNPFNDPGVTCYFLLSSLQRLPSLRIVVLICSFSVGGKGSVY